MKTRNTSEQYNLFSVLLLEEKVYLDPTLTFSDVCRWMGADEAALSTMMAMELGTDGDSLMRRYREGELSRLREKYDIDIL
ncbi:MAG: hypothetical protein ACI4AE_00505 [Candidatus Cryptobacteroides sp.]